MDKKENIIINERKKITNSKLFLPILCSFITLVICFSSCYLFYTYCMKDNYLEKEIVNKNVTISDTGISESVSKVYDAVVVIETTYNNRPYSTGTGFVFKTDDNYGYIITNYHVISESDGVNVIFTNDKKINASVVGSDEYSDIAVLRVSKDDVISVCEIGSSNDTNVGDTLFAIGAPIDSEIYSWTVTRGILSGKNRLVEATSTNGRSSFIIEVLQTDAAINSGNSGGPICNTNGQVIGVTNMKLASSSIEGMGFAIPIDTAVKYANMIISGDSISRPYVGVSIYEKTSMFTSNTSGIYIDTVEKNSPADKAGLQSGDKIIKIGDKEVSSSSYFKYELYKYNVGDTIKITYIRDNLEKEVNLVLSSTSETA